MAFDLLHSKTPNENSGGRMTHSQPKSKRKATDFCHNCRKVADFKIQGEERVYLFCEACKTKLATLFDEQNLPVAIETAVRFKERTTLVSRVAQLSESCQCDICRCPLRRLRSQPIELCDGCVERLPSSPLECLECVRNTQIFSEIHSMHLPLALSVQLGEVTLDDALLANSILDETPSIYKSSREDVNKRQTRKPSKSINKRSKKSCQICRKGVRSDLEVCGGCNRMFFRERLREEIPIILEKASEIARTNSLTLGYAINVAKGKYSLEFAKRQAKLKEQEERGYGDSLSKRGSRAPGSFGSNQ